MQTHTTTDVLFAVLEGITWGAACMQMLLALVFLVQWEPIAAAISLGFGTLSIRGILHRRAQTSTITTGE